jgi:hypothetical protein
LTFVRSRRANGLYCFSHRLKAKRYYRANRLPPTADFRLAGRCLASAVTIGRCDSHHCESGKIREKSP